MYRKKMKNASIKEIFSIKDTHCGELKAGTLHTQKRVQTDQCYFTVQITGSTF